MERLIIASDLDGTIIDHTSNKIELAKKYGYSLNRSQTASDSMGGIVALDDYLRILDELYSEKTLMAEAMVGAVHALDSLVGDFGSIYIISKVETEYSIGWIRKNIIPPLEEKNVFFVNKDEGKDSIAKSVGVNVYIDDKEGVLDEMESVTHRFLFYPYEKEIESKYPIMRNWIEFLTACKNL